MLIVVFLNTAFIATEHHGQPRWLKDFLCKHADVYRYLSLTVLLELKALKDWKPSAVRNMSRYFPFTGFNHVGFPTAVNTPS